MAWPMPWSLVFLGIITPLKNASSRKDGKTNRLNGNINTNSDSSNFGSNSCELTATIIATTKKIGKAAQAKMGTLNGDVRSPAIRLFRKYSITN